MSLQVAIPSEGHPVFEGELPGNSEDFDLTQQVKDNVPMTVTLDLARCPEPQDAMTRELEEEDAPRNLFGLQSMGLSKY